VLYPSGLLVSPPHSRQKGKSRGGTSRCSSQALGRGRATKRGVRRRPQTQDCKNFAHIRLNACFLGNRILVRASVLHNRLENAYLAEKRGRPVKAPEKGDCDEWFRSGAQTAPPGQAHVGGGPARVSARRETDRATRTQGGTRIAPQARPRASGLGPARLDRGGFRFVLRLLWGLTWRGGVAVAVILAIATGYYYVQLPDVSAAVDTRSRGSVTMLDRDGNVFAWRGDQFGGVIDPDTASPHLVHAVVATEDRRFYRHFGVSPRGIAGAIRINLREGRGPLEGHGGSTITQQVAKLMCLGVAYDPDLGDRGRLRTGLPPHDASGGSSRRCPSPSRWNCAIPRTRSCRSTSTAPIWAPARAASRAAAQRYFGVSAAELDPAQAAMLAGLLVAPSYYAPTRNLDRAQRRAATVLSLMAQEGYLTEAEARPRRTTPPPCRRPPSRISAGPSPTGSCPRGRTS
jgi:penicillin-binding protein 1A